MTAQAAEDWDGYGPAWDGYGAADEASPTEELEPKSKEADVTDAVDKLPEAAESVPEPRQDQKHIFITSQPGTGKTTLIHKLLQKLTEEDGEGGVDIFGFYTEEVKDPENPKQRLGFDVVRVGEVEEGAPKRAVLARVGQTKSSGKIARYILQQLEEMGLVEQDEAGGRMITKEGQRELDTVAVQAAAEEEEEEED